MPWWNTIRLLGVQQMQAALQKYHVSYTLSHPGILLPFHKLYISYIYLVTKEQRIWYKYIKHSKRRKRIMPIIINSCVLSCTVFILNIVEGGKPSFRLKAPESASRRRRAVPQGSAIGPELPTRRRLRPGGNSARTWERPIIQCVIVAEAGSRAVRCRVARRRVLRTNLNHSCLSQCRARVLCDGEQYLSAFLVDV